MGNWSSQATVKTSPVDVNVEISNLQSQLRVLQEENSVLRAHNSVTGFCPVPYDSLVFSGGGIKGICYVGALHVLEAHGFTNFQKFAGTSVGSLFAALCAVGYTALELGNIMQTLDFNQFFDNKHVLTEAYDFLEYYGLSSGDYLSNIVARLVEAKTGNSECTIGELYRKTGRTLVIVATNLNRRESVYFGPLNTVEQYREIPIHKAVRLSASIPFVFEAQQWNGNYYADGGVMDNFPLHVFDGVYPGDQAAINNLVPPNPAVLGINIISKRDWDTAKCQVDATINGFKDYMLSYIDIAMAENERRLMTPTFWKRSIVIPTPDFDIGTFNLPPKTQQELLLIGQQRTQHFLEENKVSHQTIATMVSATAHDHPDGIENLKFSA